MEAADHAGRTQASRRHPLIALPEIDVVVGTGTDWHDAVDDIAWSSGDMLLLGSGAAGPKAHVLLGSSASKIPRHVPVSIMIVPRRGG